MVPRNPSPSQSYNYIKSHQGDDPDYILFLNHLSPDHSGASYTLRINNNIIGYEDQDRGGSSFNYNNISNKKYINDDDCGNFNDDLDPGDASIDREHLRFLQHLKLQADGSMLLQIDGVNVVIDANDGYDDDGDDEEEVEKATGDLTVEREEDEGKVIQIQDPKQENDSPPSIGKEVPADILVRSIQ